MASIVLPSRRGNARTTGSRSGWIATEPTRGAPLTRTSPFASVRSGRIEFSELRSSTATVVAIARGAPWRIVPLTRSSRRTTSVRPRLSSRSNRPCASSAGVGVQRAGTVVSLFATNVSHSLGRSSATQVASTRFTRARARTPCFVRMSTDNPGGTLWMPSTSTRPAIELPTSGLPIVSVISRCSFNAGRSAKKCADGSSPVPDAETITLCVSSGNDTSVTSPAIRTESNVCVQSSPRVVRLRQIASRPSVTLMPPKSTTRTSSLESAIAPVTCFAGVAFAP